MCGRPIGLWCGACGFQLFCGAELVAPNCSVVRNVWLPFVRDKEHAAPYCLCLGACIGANCPGSSGTVPDLSLCHGVPESAK